RAYLLLPLPLHDALPISAGRSSSKPAVLAMATGSPATLFMMTTATAPAALAFATFWLKVHVPRSISASLPFAPGSTLVQPSDPVSKRLNDCAGNGSKRSEEHTSELQS